MPVTPCSGAGPALTGFITDPKGEAVAGAEVAAGMTRSSTTEQGAYCLDPLQTGAISVTVTDPWFQSKTLQVIVSSGGVTHLDLAISPWPLKITADDRALAAAHDDGFDWTQDMVSVVLVEEATRRSLDNAIYYQNPALYRDTSLQDAVDPSPQPIIGDKGTGASGFHFPILSGARAGQEALEETTIVDHIADTGLLAAEQADFMIWTPMRDWLADDDLEAMAGLADAEAAIHGQRWGGAALRPQEIQRVFLRDSAIWVEVVFEPFVQLGPGITDSDQDGRKEVFARVNASLYAPALVNALHLGYHQPTYDTHGLSRQLGHALNRLYTTTAAKLESTIGQAINVPGLGVIGYPFVVLKHTKGHRNVILVAP